MRFLPHLTGKPWAGVVALLALFVYWKLAVADPSAACDAGSPWACTALGHTYETGRGFGLERDLLQAARYYRRGCVGGDLDGCVMLGVMYESHHGGERAHELYAKGCERGDLAFCDVLGLSHQAGRGVAADPERAAGLYGRACDGGVWRSCLHLAALYDEGLGVPKDPAKAAQLAGWACGHGVAEGCIVLAERHWRGIGAQPDPERAKLLRRAACEMLHIGAFTRPADRDRRERYCALAGRSPSAMR